MQFIIGLDIGTTACKAIALDDRGQVVASTQEYYALSVPQQGWVEQQIEEIWHAVAKGLTHLSFQLPTASIIGIGLSGAMHSVILLDGHDEPLAPAITWADQRAEACAQALRAQIDSISLYQRTGCPLQPMYHPAKVRWCVDITGKRFARIVSIKESILHRLTGIWAIDLGLASTTGLLNIHQHRWDAQALSLAGIAETQLSPLVSCESVVGTITHEAAGLTGLPKGLPVVAGGSDGGMAMVGAKEHTVITVGTSGAIRRVASSPLLDSQARTWCYVQDASHWLVGGAINNGGLAAQWAKEKFYPHDDYETMFEEVAGIEPGAAGVMCLPYLTGERSPHWNAQVRATLSGIGLEHSRGHIARAVLEGVAFCLADVWEIVGHASSAGLTGGITQSLAWSQIVCDVLGVPMDLAREADASAIGAARTTFVALSQLLPLQ